MFQEVSDSNTNVPLPDWGAFDSNFGATAVAASAPRAAPVPTTIQQLSPKKADLGGFGISFFIEPNGSVKIDRVTASVSRIVNHDDELVKIDGTSVTGSSLLQLRNLVMGQIGSSAHVVLNRNINGRITQFETTLHRLPADTFQF